MQERGTGPALTPPDEGTLARRRVGVLALVAGAVILADQLTKRWALDALADGPIHVVWTLRLALTFNSGTAFSVARGRGGLVGVVALAVVLVLIWAGRSVTSKLGAAGMGLVLGGAVGNLLDRALREGPGFLGGSVVDFIDLQWWPVFNVADAGIVVGGLLLVAISWQREGT